MIEFTDEVPPEAAAAAAGERGQHAQARVAVVRGGWHKEDAIGQFGEVLGFPNWFGHNLDALADLLPDDVHRRAEVEAWWLVWVPSRHLIDTHQADYAGIVDILANAADEPGARVTIVGPPPA
jgi:RNAse (barnase) inhibitor barstar